MWLVLYSQVVQGFISNISAGSSPAEQWQQVNIEVIETTPISTQSSAVLAPSAFVDQRGSLFFQLMPNRCCDCAV